MKLILLLVLIAVTACTARWCEHGPCYHIFGPGGEPYMYRRSMPLKDLAQQPKISKDLPEEVGDDDLDLSQVSKPVMLRALWSLIWPLMQQFAEQMDE